MDYQSRHDAVIERMTDAELRAFINAHHRAGVYDSYFERATRELNNRQGKQ